MRLALLILVLTSACAEAKPRRPAAPRPSPAVTPPPLRARSAHSFTDAAAGEVLVYRQVPRVGQYRACLRVVAQGDLSAHAALPGGPILWSFHYADTIQTRCWLERLRARDEVQVVADLVGHGKHMVELTLEAEE